MQWIGRTPSWASGWPVATARSEDGKGDGARRPARGSRVQPARVGFDHMRQEDSFMSAFIVPQDVTAPEALLWVGWWQEGDPSPVKLRVSGDDGYQRERNIEW